MEEKKLSVKEMLKQAFELKKEIIKLENQKRKILNREKRQKIINDVKINIEAKITGMGAKISEHSHEYSETIDAKKQICKDAEEYIKEIEKQCEKEVAEQNEVIEYLLEKKQEYASEEVIDKKQELQEESKDNNNKQEHSMEEKTTCITEKITQLCNQIQVEENEEVLNDITKEIINLKREKQKLIKEEEAYRTSGNNIHGIDEKLIKENKKTAALELIAYVEKLIDEIENNKQNIINGYEDKKETILEDKTAMLAKVNEISRWKKFTNFVSFKLTSSKTWANRIMEEVLIPTNAKIGVKLKEVKEYPAQKIGQFRQNLNQKEVSAKEKFQAYIAGLKDKKEELYLGVNKDTENREDSKDGTGEKNENGNTSRFKLDEER